MALHSELSLYDKDIELLFNINYKKYYLYTQTLHIGNFSSMQCPGEAVLY